MPKQISILGSTGSIGVNALKVADHLAGELKVVYLSAHSNSARLIEQAEKFNPKAIAIVDPNAYQKVKNTLGAKKIEILKGREGLLNLASRDDVDIMLNGLVGAGGMEPTLNAIDAGVDVALSNKESLVMAGDIIYRAMERTGAKLFPVDSEHSAIWQCMAGENVNDIRSLILTGSGGPFRNRPLNTFQDISVEEALNHPNWDMGKKISIDSATMMNKGLEFIEAFHLFQLPSEQIEVLIHPQSIVHSLVYFRDGSVLAQMANPDMRIPNAYGLTYPNRIDTMAEELDLVEIGQLDFQQPNLDRFPCLSLGMNAAAQGGTAPTILNAANEIAVSAFLKEELKFSEISLIIEEVMSKIPCEAAASLAIIQDADKRARNLSKELILKNI